MDRFDDDTVFAELRELRPKPRPEFAAKLDERAAAGFPRRSTPYTSPAALVADWWRDLSLRSRLIPAVGVALMAVVVATAVIAISNSGGGAGSGNRHGQFLSQVETFGSSGEGAESGDEAAAEESSSSAEAQAAPSVKAAPKAEAEGAGGAVNGNELPKANDLGRDIEKSSYVVLGTKPGAVSGAAAKVFDAVHAADGVVLRSSVQSGSKGATGATFSLLIPSARVNDALAQISAIAEVRERHDATSDITAPTVSAAEELADSNAAIEGLLKELGNAETEAERESVETRLREERRHHAAIRASLDHLHERAAMSEVTVRIVTGEGAGVAPAGKGPDSGWGVGDALHDAGHILTIAAGVVLIALAVLAPIALIALLIWTANRIRVRRLRERTLG